MAGGLITLRPRHPTLRAARRTSRVGGCGGRVSDTPEHPAVPIEARGAQPGSAASRAMPAPVLPPIPPYPPGMVDEAQREGWRRAHTPSDPGLAIIFANLSAGGGGPNPAKVRAAMAARRAVPTIIANIVGGGGGPDHNKVRAAMAARRADTVPGTYVGMLYSVYAAATEAAKRLCQTGLKAVRESAGQEPTKAQQIAAAFEREGWFAMPEREAMFRGYMDACIMANISSDDAVKARPREDLLSRDEARELYRDRTIAAGKKFQRGRRPK